jgi:hypothetical protein
MGSKVKVSKLAQALEASAIPSRTARFRLKFLLGTQLTNVSNWCQLMTYYFHEASHRYASC